MEILKETKLKDILAQYPWLLEEAVNFDERFRLLKSPVGKLFIKNATIEELAKKAGITPEEIINFINEMVASHQNA